MYSRSPLIVPFCKLAIMRKFWVHCLKSKFLMLKTNFESANGLRMNHKEQVKKHSFDVGTFNSFLTGLDRNQVYGAYCSANKPVFFIQDQFESKNGVPLYNTTIEYQIFKICNFHLMVLVRKTHK